MAKVRKRSNGAAEIESTKVKKPRSLPKDKQPTHSEEVPDSEEDPGHSASLAFLAAAKETAKRSNALIASHTRTVEEELQRLKGTLNGKASAITVRDAQLQTSFLNVLAKCQEDVPQQDEARSKESRKGEPAGITIYQNGLSIISLSRELMTQYGKVCEQVTLGEGALKKSSGREDECEVLQQILHRQGEKVKVELHHFLYGDSKESPEMPSDEATASDRDLWNRYATTSNLDGKKAGTTMEQPWAAVAKNAQRAVHRMVKDLPTESEG